MNLLSTWFKLIYLNLLICWCLSVRMRLELYIFIDLLEVHEPFYYLFWFTYLNLFTCLKLVYLNFFTYFDLLERFKLNLIEINLLDLFTCLKFRCLSVRKRLELYILSNHGEPSLRESSNYWYMAFGHRN